MQCSYKHNMHTIQHYLMTDAYVIVLTDHEAIEYIMYEKPAKEEIHYIHITTKYLYMCKHNFKTILFSHTCTRS